MKRLWTGVLALVLNDNLAVGVRVCGLPCLVPAQTNRLDLGMDPHTIVIDELI